MNRHRGRDVDEYLKERGIFEEVEALAEKRLAALRADEALELEGTVGPPDKSPNRISRFLKWLRHAFNL